MKRKVLFALATLITVGTGAARIGSAEPAVVRSAMAGGGSSATPSVNFELSAVIGQPVVGSASGGTFNLSVGYLFALAPTDCNQDGVVNLLDHESLTQCITGPGGAAATGSCRCFDADGNGKVDLGDFAIAQAAHSG